MAIVCNTTTENVHTKLTNDQDHIQEITDTQPNQSANNAPELNLPISSRHAHAPKCFYIRSQRALKSWTWVIFVTTVLTCATTILTSVYLMLDCRFKLEGMRAVLVNTNDKYCTDLGLQVLFACTVILLAAFGQGCVDRKITGYAMMIISGVAIFQSTTTYIFNECRTGIKDDFMTSISSSLGACRLGSSNPPFEFKKHYYHYYLAEPGAIPAEDSETKSGADIFKKSTGEENRSKKTGWEQVHGGTAGSLSKRESNENRVDDLFVKQMVLNLSSFESFSHVHDPSTACDKSSAYISLLARFVSEDDLETCVKLCHTYQDFCSHFLNDVEDEEEFLVKAARLSSSPVTNEEDVGAKTSKHSISEFRNKKLNSEHASSHTRGIKESSSEKVSAERENDENEEDIHDFDNVVKSCSAKMWHRLREFCFYDNMIFMPLSLGGPIVYMVLSLAFLYLGHCGNVLNNPPNDLQRDKSETSLIPVVTVVEPRATPRRRSSTHPENKHGPHTQKTSVTSLIFGPKQTAASAPPSPVITATRQSKQHSLENSCCTGSSTNPLIIPKLNVFNERMSLDYSYDFRNQESYGRSNESILSEPCEYFRKGGHPSSEASPAPPSSPSSRTSPHDLVYLRLPPSSITSNLTTELYITDSD